ncbi:hypothetical protein [uncultured Nisaea sp.]|mgnify:FL=1|uniref:hypothetical protein n=1 Tax=uncultured Nisaea sp. TaxID=538215 RepID=UPI0030EF9464|tara:strand:+ start:5655 stop:6254 length:600 start_codon:yes stop_codon:yes gene_type:complete
MPTHAILPFRLLLLRIAAGLIGMLLAFSAGEAFSASWKNPDRHDRGNYPDSYCRTTYKHDNERHRGRQRGPGHYEIVRGKCHWVTPRKQQRTLYKVVPVYPAQPPKAVWMPTYMPVPVPAPAPAVTPAYCREYQDTISVGGTAVPAYGNACLQADGSWQVRSGPVPASGDHCREFRRSVAVGSSEEQQVGTACLRPGDV